MKINIPMEYLSSKAVHNGYVFKYDDQIFRDRFVVLDKLLTDKDRVIDLGCVGYIPNIKSSINCGTYLHDILTKKCNDVLGVDINTNGVEFVRKLGFTNVVCADIISDASTIKKHFMNSGVDFMILGEMLHEVDNPIQFLSDIHKEYEGCVRKIIITVPNIYRLTNIVNAVGGKDVNHTENRYWFSPYTICKSLAQAGIQPTELYLAGKTFGKRGLLLSLFKHNICAEHIIAVGTL